MNDRTASEAPPIRLVLSDLDGTLLTSAKVLTKRTISAISRLHEANILFAITSGRPPRGMRMITEVVSLTTPISGFNGGLIVRPDFSVQSEHRLAEKDTRAVIQKLRENGLDVWLYTDSEWFVTNAAAPHVAKEQATVKFAPVVIEDFESHLGEAIKIVGVSDDPSLVARCEDEFGGWAEGRVSARRSQPYYLDVTHPLATKGQVVKMLSIMYGISSAHIATIGDGPNDTLMFKESGISIAMGNASPEVQRSATRVTSSFDDEGFAEAMERYVFSTIKEGHS